MANRNDIIEKLARRWTDEATQAQLALFFYETVAEVLEEYTDEELEQEHLDTFNEAVMW
jgi:hypothetical protein